MNGAGLEFAHILVQLFATERAVRNRESGFVIDSKHPLAVLLVISKRSNLSCFDPFGLISSSTHSRTDALVC